MADTTFVKGTIITEDWLNDVNDLVYGGGGFIAASSITNTPAGNIAATNVQAAINELDTEKQPLNSNLTSIAALTTAAYGRSLLETASEAALKALINLEIGTDVQAYDATLTAFAGGLTAANKIPYATALNILGELDFKDEDDMASNSATAIPSQQSVKAYVDAQAGSLTIETKKATTSGTSVEWTSLPAGIKRISVIFNGVSPGDTHMGIQIGDSGGYETTGYSAPSATIATSGITANNITTEYRIGGSNFVSAANGTVVLSLFEASTNTWSIDGSLVEEISGTVHFVQGYKALSGTLDRIKILVGGTFSSGNANIIYE